MSLLQEQSTQHSSFSPYMCVSYITHKLCVVKLKFYSGAKSQHDLLKLKLNSYWILTLLEPIVHTLFNSLRFNLRKLSISMPNNRKMMLSNAEMRHRGYERKDLNDMRAILLYFFCFLDGNLWKIAIQPKRLPFVG